MMSLIDDEMKTAIIVVIVAFVLSTAISWHNAGIEAETFNRLCGTNITTHDALFTDLRVDSTCKGDKP